MAANRFLKSRRDVCSKSVSVSTDESQKGNESLSFDFITCLKFQKRGNTGIPPIYGFIAYFPHFPVALIKAHDQNYAPFTLQVKPA